MGILDRLFGRGDGDRERREREAQAGYGRVQGGYGADAGRYGRRNQTPTDEQALERYRYMLRTAPPDQIEQAHAEAFAKLTPEQRQMALQELANNVPAGERPTSDDPRSLARAATRAEMRQPGTIERAFGGARGGMGGMGMGGIGMGGMLAGSFMATLAGSFIGTAIAQSFFDNDPGFAESGYAGEEQGEYAGVEEQSLDPQEDYAGDAGADFGDGGDFGGGEF